MAGIATAVIGAASLAAGLIEAGVAGAKGAEAAREQRNKEAIINAQNAANEALLNKRLYQDVTKRTDVQNMIRVLDEKQQKQAARDEAIAANTGASAEASLAAADNRNKSYADAVADLASTASLKNDQVLIDAQRWTNEFYNNRNGMQDVLAGIYNNQAAQWSQGGTNALTAGTKELAGGLEKVFENKA